MLILPVCGKNVLAVYKVLSAPQRTIQQATAKQQTSFIFNLRQDNARPHSYTNGQRRQGQTLTALT